ncbi:hypothetical protein ACHAPU_009047 [Fusarium lateritium]
MGASTRIRLRQLDRHQDHNPSLAVVPEAHPERNQKLALARELPLHRRDRISVKQGRREHKVDCAYDPVRDPILVHVLELYPDNDEDRGRLHALIVVHVVGLAADLGLGHLGLRVDLPELDSTHDPTYDLPLDVDPDPREGGYLRDHVDFLLRLFIPGHTPHLGRSPDVDDNRVRVPEDGIVPVQRRSLDYNLEVPPAAVHHDLRARLQVGALVLAPEEPEAGPVHRYVRVYVHDGVLRHANGHVRLHDEPVELPLEPIRDRRYGHDSNPDGDLDHVLHPALNDDPVCFHQLDNAPVVCSITYKLSHPSRVSTNVTIGFAQTSSIAISGSQM